MKNNNYKKHLGMTLQGLGDLVGLTKEGVRLKLQRYNKWRNLARLRLAQLGEARAEIDRLKQQIAKAKLKQMPTEKTASVHSIVADITVKEQAWREIIFSSVRAMHALERLNITSVDSLLEFGLLRLAQQYSVGKKTIGEIRQILGNHGLMTIDTANDPLTHTPYL